METFITISRIVHIIAGSLALLSGLGAILARKKVKVHKPFGKIYLYSMWVIFITAMYLSIYRQSVFLFFIGVFTFHSCITAFRSLKLKKLHLGQKPLKTDWAIEGFNVLACGGLIILGIILLLKNNIEFGIICSVFGVIGIRLSASNIKRLRGKVKGANYWLLSHIGGMLGSYIGAITAFTVNNNRWMGMPQVVAWLAPTLIIVPFIFYEIARFQKSPGIVNQ